MTPQEFGQLFMRYRDRYISIARSYIRDDIAAEDIVAESFTNFWDNRDKIELDNVPEAYIAVCKEQVSQLSERQDHTAENTAEDA